MNYIAYLKSSRFFYFLGFLSLVLISLGIYLGYFTNSIKYILEHNRHYSLFGIAFILAFASVFSNNRAQISKRLIISGLLIHIILAIIILKTQIGQLIFESIGNTIGKLYLSANSGINFVFGPLSIVNKPSDFIFAIKVLPVIIFFGAVMSLLFYWGIIQKIVGSISYILKPILGTSGAETLCSVANCFLGQTEAPLLVKNYLKGMTKSEFLLVMISGMASISAAILAVYAGMGVPAKHLLAASVMSIPAGIIISKILYPETEKPETSYGAKVEFKSSATNMFDAISAGTSDGLYLALNVGAMLISFIALIFVFNALLGFTCTELNLSFKYLNIAFQLPILSLDMILSWICLPFSWLLGFTGQEALVVGELIGTKVAVNELVAYSKLISSSLSERTIAILTYALCGFSNFSCIGIQIGGIGALVPEKRNWLSELGLKALFGAVLANLLSALVANILL